MKLSPLLGAATILASCVSTPPDENNGEFFAEVSQSARLSNDITDVVYRYKNLGYTCAVHKERTSYRCSSVVCTITEYQTYFFEIRNGKLISANEISYKMPCPANEQDVEDRMSAPNPTYRIL